jgi:hypothetical protein
MRQTLSVQAAYLCSQYSEWSHSARNETTVRETCELIASKLRRIIEESEGHPRLLGKKLREFRSLAKDLSEGLTNTYKRATYAGLVLRLNKILGK